MTKTNKEAPSTLSKISGKRQYTSITDEMRFRLIFLIKNQKMSCHKASKVIGIAYNNAKVIYRIYRNEGRIKQTPK